MSMKPDDIVAHVNADRDLDPATAAALARLICLAHAAAICGEFDKDDINYLIAREELDRCEERDRLDADRDTASDLAREQGAP